jgi:hypothetical protein
MLKWEWYTNVNTRILFFHCLLNANWESGSWHGIDYEPGDFITSLPNLATGCGLTIQQTRTALSNLQSTGEITVKSFSQGRIITINNWTKYQAVTDKITENQQASNRQPNRQSTGNLTSDKEYKEYKNKEYKNNNIKRFVPPTVEEVRAYCQERKNGINAQRFIDFYTAKGWMLGKNHMKDWKAAVRTWEGREKNGTISAGNNTANEDYTAIDETIRRIESGEADHDDDGLWD